MFIVNCPISIRARDPLQIFLAWCLTMYPLVVAGAEIGGKPEKSDITVAYVSPSAAFTPLFVAAEAGLLAKYGLKAKLQFLNTAVAVKGLLAEEVDFCVDGPALLIPRLSGARVKYFGAYMQQFVFQIWGAKEIISRAVEGKDGGGIYTPRRHRHRHARDAQEIRSYP